MTTDKGKHEPKRDNEPTDVTDRATFGEPKDQIHIPESELIRGSGGKGFAGILFAFAALGVLFWVYSRLIEPYPGHASPNEAIKKVKGASETTEDNSTAGHDMSKMALGTTTSDASGTVKSEFEARLASFSEDKCPPCGMAPSKSSAMIAAFIEDKWVGFDSFSCFFDYTKSKTASEIEVLNYTTRSKDDAEKKMIKAADAYYLVGLDGAIKGSMPPGVPAFLNETDAKGAIGDLGGRIVRYNEMKSFVESGNL